MARGSKPGERRGGRKKGSPNKLTQAAHEAMDLAFEGVGGVKALTTWGVENRTEFFKLWARRIPNMQEHKGAVRLNIEYVEADD